MINLVIAAHPDDEVLGCGGTIAKLADAGEFVYVAILGEGVTSRYAAGDAVDKTSLDLLNESSLKSAKILGVKELFQYALPDNRFDTVPLLDIVKIIEKLTDKVQPQRVFTHHCGDLNVDHTAVFRATITALRPIKGCTVKSIYMYEVPSSTEWAFGRLEANFSPNVVVDVSTTLDCKLKAMGAYETELRPFPHPRSLESLKAAAVRWGSVVGLDAAEAFEVLRETL